MLENQPDPIDHLQNLITNSRDKEELIKQARLDILNNLETAQNTTDSGEAEKIYTTVIAALTQQAQNPEEFAGQALFEDNEMEKDLGPLLKSIEKKHNFQSLKDQQLDDLLNF